MFTTWRSLKHNLLCIYMLRFILAYGPLGQSNVATAFGSHAVNGEAFPLCDKLLRALHAADGDSLSHIKQLGVHLQLEQHHSQRARELQLDLELLRASDPKATDHDTEQDLSSSAEPRRLNIADVKLLLQQHVQARQAHASAKEALLQRLRQTLLPPKAAHAQNAATEGPSSGDLGPHAPNLPLWMLPHCAQARLNADLYDVYDHPPATTSLHIAVPATGWHTRHGHRVQQRVQQHQDGQGAPSVQVLQRQEQQRRRVRRSLWPLRQLAGAGGGPTVSLMVQYYARPWVLPMLVAPFEACAREDPHGLEVLINVDSRPDAEEVARLAARYPPGFVVPVFSDDVHEIRAYNRLAALARGSVLVMLQDDDLFPATPATCAWLDNVVRAFAHWPRLGALGSQRYVVDYHPNTTQWGVHFRERRTTADFGAAFDHPAARRWRQRQGAYREQGKQAQQERHGQAQGPKTQGRLRGDEAEGNEGGAAGLGIAQVGARSFGQRGSQEVGVGPRSQRRSQQQEGGQEQQGRMVAEAERQRQWEGPGEAAAGAGRGGGWAQQPDGEEVGADDGVGWGMVEPDGRLRMQFVALVDYAPIAVRAAALRAVGGLDEAMSPPGGCGVHSDYDVSLRMWMAGWQVAYMEGPGLTRDPHEEEGGSHRPGASGLCWERQWEQAIAYMRQRWGQHNRWDPGSYYWFGSNVSEVISEHVRQLNVRLLERIDPSSCPLGYGCTADPADWMAGVPAAIQPPFGGLSSWPKHRRASWRVPFRQHGRAAPRGGGGGGGGRRGSGGNGNA